MKKLFVLLSLLISSTGCSSQGVPSIQTLRNLPKFGSFKKDAPPVHPALVLLGFKSSIFDKHVRGFCSGTVIDNNYIVTAGHCITDERYRLSKETIYILDDMGRDTGITAKPAGINLRQDYGIITGDFSSFSPVPINFYDMPFLQQGPYAACGFPGGQHRPTCVALGHVIPYEFYYAADAQLIPGMSGGPVLDLSNPMMPVLVAVNSAVTGEPPRNVVVTPIIGLLGAFDIEPDNE